ncbi:carboxylesterase/lipase family protein [Streptomyces sp. NPDC051561]|uniref:carboxylesterase/lipase family protein n=1 Tax=Streptomyces sp. NPDC051561 TaxID=3365658 RepID=UPI0037BC84E0
MSTTEMATPATGPADEDRLVVATSAGAVRGTVRHSSHAWLGVPFAQPPVGELRWRAPRAPLPWEGVREATGFGPAAVQLPRFDPTAPPYEGDSEDCLYLNVFAPMAESATARPVLVWIHGGGFVFGTGKDYDGTVLAERGDCVVVTFNYRLSSWGFLHLAGVDPSVADTNVGVRDQVAALAWVRDNIAAFGGDPARVTLVGESAGGMSVGTLLGVPAARGLFHGAVVLSGGAAEQHDAATGTAAAKGLLSALGIPETEAARLREVPVAELRDATFRLAMTGGHEGKQGIPYLPVVDGDLVPEVPLAAVERGEAAEVPLLVAYCRDEMAIFTLGGDDTPITKSLEAAVGEEAWAELLGRYEQFEPEGATVGGSPRKTLLGDAMFVMPSVRLAEAQVRAGGRAWMHRFDHQPPMEPYHVLGPTHAADIPCLWSREPSFDLCALSGEPADGFLPMSEDDKAASAALQDAVLGMVREGRPVLPDGPHWPGYDEKARPMMLITARPELAEDPTGERRAAWDGLRD